MANFQSKIISIEKRLDELEETMEILGDKKTTRSIERGLRDLRQGRSSRYESADALFEKNTSQQ